MGELTAVALTVTLWLVGLYALYWTIRLAVRHALSDTDRRREDGERRAAGSDALAAQDRRIGAPPP